MDRSGLNPAQAVVWGSASPPSDSNQIDLIQEVAAELGKIAKVRFRVKPTMSNLWRPTDFSQMTVPIDLGVQVYKSGISPEYLVEMGHRVFAMPNVELVGLHTHSGRHHPSLWYWEGMMVRFARLVGELSRAWDGWQPSEIDIGATAVLRGVDRRRANIFTDPTTTVLDRLVRMAPGITQRWLDSKVAGIAKDR